MRLGLSGVGGTLIKTMPRLVSIIIPCYNAAPWLERTLISALSETWTPTEVIVIDDGSTDASLGIARRFESKGVIVVGQRNAGASSARNHGLRLAHGDYIQFLDADDLLAADKIARQLALAERCAPDTALCCTWTRFTRDPNDADFTAQVLCRDASPVDWVSLKFENDAMMHPAAWLIPRSLCDRAGPWDESLSLDDDGEYFSRIVLASSGVRFCREAVSFYRSNIAGTLSGAKSERAWDSALRSLEKSTALLRRTEDSPRTRKACAIAFQQFIYSSYPAAPSCRRRAEDNVAALGGTDLKPSGGPAFQAARSLLGWRLARRIGHLLRP
jgi:glycosyltransferase involved in cell wall biosynthesis